MFLLLFLFKFLSLFLIIGCTMLSPAKNHQWSFKNNWLWLLWLLVMVIVVIVVIGYGYCASCLEIQLNLVEESFFTGSFLIWWEMCYFWLEPEDFWSSGRKCFLIGTGRFLIWWEKGFFYRKFFNLVGIFSIVRFLIWWEKVLLQNL